MKTIGSKVIITLGISAAIAVGVSSLNSDAMTERTPNQEATKPAVEAPKPAMTADARPPYPLVEQGRDLAEMWCNACHVTGTGITEDAMDAAPPFPSIAGAVAANPEFYRGFLMNPHDPMEELSLSRHEIDALVAYIGSLAQ